MYRGKSVWVERVEGDIVELCFDRSDGDINKFDLRTIQEFRDATAAIAKGIGICGVLVSSAKDTFIVGADIFEFRDLFRKTSDQIAEVNADQSAVFTMFEDLPIPTVVAINGLALGGGFEMALTADYRVIVDGAQIGLPEVNLGLFPGYGGTVRLPRLCGVGTALEWIVTGRSRRPSEALAAGVVDFVVTSGDLRSVAISTLRSAAANENWRDRRSSRRGAVAVKDPQTIAALKERAERVANHYPAALAVIELVASSADLGRDEALKAESRAFGRIAKTPTASALVQVFVNDQILKRRSKAYLQSARRIEKAAVLGAGIMGGGIACTSATNGTPVLMKDVASSALDLGLREVERLLEKQVASGRVDAVRATAIRGSITPSLTYAGFSSVDIVIEAIVENVDIKKRVLSEAEGEVGPDAIMASNTSSLSIDVLAAGLKRPENFVGMHFFNPGPVTPLAEVLRGRETSDATVGSVVRYALAIGKTPVVLQDCPGFLVNRVLNAYFVGFSKLIRDGADFIGVDEAMEAFGWPMGPAYLQDVVGMDTSSHVFATIAASYPARMALDFTNPMQLMANVGRYGQKTKLGFYRYVAGVNARPSRHLSEDSRDILVACQPGGQRTFSDMEIVDRMMMPMILEAAVCLQDGIAMTASEIDMALVLGTGFPRHHGGPLAYADAVGLRTVARKCEDLAHLGAAYAAPELLIKLADTGRGFYD